MGKINLVPDYWKLSAYFLARGGRDFMEGRRPPFVDASIEYQLPIQAGSISSSNGIDFTYSGQSGLELTFKGLPALYRNLTALVMGNRHQDPQMIAAAQSLRSGVSGRHIMDEVGIPYAALSKTNRWQAIKSNLEVFGGFFNHYEMEPAVQLDLEGLQGIGNAIVDFTHVVESARKGTHMQIISLLNDQWRRQGGRLSVQPLSGHNYYDLRQLLIPMLQDEPSLVTVEGEGVESNLLSQKFFPGDLNLGLHEFQGNADQVMLLGLLQVVTGWYNYSPKDLMVALRDLQIDPEEFGWSSLPTDWRRAQWIIKNKKTILEGSQFKGQDGYAYFSRWFTEGRMDDGYDLARALFTPTEFAQLEWTKRLTCSSDTYRLVNRPYTMLPVHHSALRYLNKWLHDSLTPREIYEMRNSLLEGIQTGNLKGENGLYSFAAYHFRNNLRKAGLVASILLNDEEFEALNWNDFLPEGSTLTVEMPNTTYHSWIEKFGPDTMEIMEKMNRELEDARNDLPTIFDALKYLNADFKASRGDYLDLLRQRLLEGLSDQSFVQDEGLKKFALKYTLNRIQPAILIAKFILTSDEYQRLEWAIRNQPREYSKRPTLNEQSGSPTPGIDSSGKSSLALNPVYVEEEVGSQKSKPSTGQVESLVRLSDEMIQQLVEVRALLESRGCEQALLNVQNILERPTREKLNLLDGFEGDAVSMARNIAQEAGEENIFVQVESRLKTMQAFYGSASSSVLQGKIYLLR